MAASRGDLERAHGVGLAADVGEVELVARRRHRLDGDRRRRRRLGRSAMPRRLAASRPAARVSPSTAAASRQLSCGTSTVAMPRRPARQADGQRPPHRLDLTVKGQLTDDGERTESPVLQRASGGQDAERDGQVERRALLAQTGGGEVHRQSRRAAIASAARLAGSAARIAGRPAIGLRRRGAGSYSWSMTERSRSKQRRTACGIEFGGIGDAESLAGLLADELGLGTTFDFR